MLPDSLVDAFMRARLLSDRHSPGAMQDVLARFIGEGHLLRHLRRMRDLYRERQASLIHSLTRATHGAIDLSPSLQGLHLAFEVGERVRDTELSQRAAGVGVQLAPISSYCIDARRRGWLFGYAGYEEAALTRAANALGGQVG